MSLNFALVGAGGYIAPRHIKAIYETGNKLVAALDPKDSVGIIDQYFFDTQFFTETERFDRYLEKLRREPDSKQIHYLSVCSPNYLHDAHCRLGIRAGANVICEKPLVINPWNLDALQALESEYSRKIYSVLQLRYHPKLVKVHDQILQVGNNRHNVILTYVTSRGPWYDVSWKGSVEKSGGLVVNIGIHLFDLLLWLFGPLLNIKIYCSEQHKISGYMELQKADVKWFLSIDRKDLPFELMPGSKSSYRSMVIDDEEIEFSDGFTDLHTRTYEHILMGNGFGTDDARPSIELTYRLRRETVSDIDELAHPYLLDKRGAND